MFVESYGRVAIEDPAIAPEVNGRPHPRHRLVAGGRLLLPQRLPHLAHVRRNQLAGPLTLQSGLWIDNQQRYNELLQSNRLTLSSAFKRAGWRTVAADPSNTDDWPEGKSFYHYDAIYDSRNVGYAGPSFSYATMPDQYTLAALHRNELAESRPLARDGRGRPGVLARSVGTAAADGRLEGGRRRLGLRRHARAGSAAQGPARRHADKTKAAYGQSIQYSMSALISFVETSTTTIWWSWRSATTSRRRWSAARTRPRRTDHDHRARS